jgi:long-chain fatty acid transport protein
MTVRRLKLALICSGVLLPATALAGGFDAAENGPRAIGRGGAYAASVDEPSALYYNPAALTRVRGLAATVNLNLMRANVEFDRDTFVLTPGIPETTSLYREIDYAPVQNETGFYPAPMLFVSHNFGLENWTFAFGVYGPPAVGSQRFPEMTTAREEPGTIRDGGQSYSIVSSDLLLFYPSLAAAYRIAPANLSVGLTLQAAVLDVNYNVGVDGISGPGTALTPFEERPQLYTPNVLEVRGATATGILGVMWDPNKNLSIGASYRPRFRIRGRGDIDVVYPPELAEQDPFIDDTDATLTTRLPDVVRLGAVYRALDADDNQLWNIEANVVYEGWSYNKGFEVDLEGTLRTGTEAIDPQRLPDLFLPRFYNDTVSFRLGSDLSMLRNENGNGPVFRLGAAYETNGAPSEYTNLDFIAFEKVTGGVGISYHIGPVAIDLAGGYVWMPERVVDDGEYALLAPLWECSSPDARPEACNTEGIGPKPVNNGRYNASFSMMSLGFTYGW